MSLGETCSSWREPVSCNSWPSCERRPREGRIRSPATGRQTKVKQGRGGREWAREEEGGEGQRRPEKAREGQRRPEKAGEGRRAPGTESYLREDAVEMLPCNLQQVLGIRAAATRCEVTAVLEAGRKLRAVGSDEGLLVRSRCAAGEALLERLEHPRPCA